MAVKVTLRHLVFLIFLWFLVSLVVGWFREFDLSSLEGKSENWFGSKTRKREIKRTAPLTVTPVKSASRKYVRLDEFGLPENVEYGEHPNKEFLSQHFPKAYKVPRPVTIYAQQRFGDGSIPRYLIEGQELCNNCKISTDESDATTAEALLYVDCPGRPLKSPESKQKTICMCHEASQGQSAKGNFFFKSTYSRCDITATYRLGDDIPSLWLGRWAKNYLPADWKIHDSHSYIKKLLDPPPKLRNKSPVLFLQSNCKATSKRQEMVRELMQYIDVDAPGRCLNNRELSHLLPSVNESESQFVVKARLSEHYKFTIALENTVEKDYRTEKLFAPLLAGSIPIIFGKPNAAPFLPSLVANHSAIFVEDFKSMKELANYLKRLDKDEEAYMNYFKWKITPINPSFAKLLPLGGNTQTCRMCEYLASMVKNYDE